MNRSRHARVPAGAAIAVLACSLAVASDWSRWLGPDQNGQSPETGVFDRTAPDLALAWLRPLGVAYSAIAVVDGKAITMFGDGETDWLTAIDAANGKEIWRYRIGTMFPKIGGADGGQLSMPVVDGGNVYGLGAAGQLFAVRLRDGSQVWSVRIDRELGARRPHFGFTTTPLIVGNLLFLQTGGADGHSLTGLDKRTGKRLWSTGDEAVGYQSPILARLAGLEQIVAVTNKSVVGIRSSNGAVLWRKEHRLVERDGWSTPVALGGDGLLLTGRTESAAFGLERIDGGFSVKELWRVTNLKGNFAMPVVHGRHIYGYDGDFLTCVDARTGHQLWKSRSDGAGLILVDGHLVIFGADGDVIVGEASPSGFKRKTSLKVTERAGFTFPSFSNGGIFVRNLESIARINVQSESP